MVGGPRAGVDDEALARSFIRYVGVAKPVARCVTMFSLQLIELVPGGLLVSQVDAPLNVYERPGVPSAFIWSPSLRGLPMGCSSS